MTGKIIAIVHSKRCLFIATDAHPDADFFAHRDDLRDLEYDQLRVGDAVDFDAILDAPKGPRAHAVRKPNTARNALDKLFS